MTELDLNPTYTYTGRKIKTIFCYDARPLPGPAMKINAQLTLTDKPKLDTLNCSSCSYL